MRNTKGATCAPFKEVNLTPLANEPVGRSGLAPSGLLFFQKIFPEQPRVFTTFRRVASNSCRCPLEKAHAPGAALPATARRRR